MAQKRILDIILSFLILVMILPIIAVIAAQVWLMMGFPIFFCQLRPGYRGRPFKLCKFRTMNDTSELQGKPLPDAARLTKLGRFLRSTSLDELPELINVLRGDMSLVGPRPLLMQYLGRYTPDQARRHEVKPGMTGLAQVEGRNTLTWEQKFCLDTWYVDNLSFRLDLEIIARTIIKSIKREGINQLGQATMEEFMGSAVEQGK